MTTSTTTAETTTTSPTSTECKFIVDTKYGELLIVDEVKNYRESKEFCEKKLDGKLPTISNETMITDLKSYLLPCTKHGYHGNVYEMTRNERKWRVGLSYDNGEGVWSDGRKYDYKTDQPLFKYSYNAFTYGYQPDPYKGCQNAVLYAYDGFMSSGMLETVTCEDQHPFLCLRERSTNATTENPFKSFADYNIASNENSPIGAPGYIDDNMLGRAFSNPAVIGLTVLAAFLLLFHIFFVVRSVVRKSRMYKGITADGNKQEDDDIELQPLDSNSTSQTNSEGVPDV